MADFSRELAGQHAVVTGGGKGIGAAVAEALARRGASLTLLGRDAERVRAQAHALAQAHGVDAQGDACDVAAEASVASAFTRAAEARGPVSILVNNAGIAGGTMIADMDVATWNRVLAVNLTGSFLCARAVLPAMLAARAGRIVNVASTAGLRGYKAMGAYCASKHGVIGLTRALAQEVAKHGVTVNAVCPGYVDTDMAQLAIDNLMGKLGVTADEALAMLVRPIPRGQLTQPHEVAEAVAWLCSRAAAAVSGIALPIAGGEVT